MSNSLGPCGLQHTTFPCPPLSPGACTDSNPLGCCYNLTISSSAASFPVGLSLSQDQGLFQWVGSSHQVAKVFELQLQYQSVCSISPVNVQYLLSLGFTSALHVLQGTLKSLLRHHNLKASVLQRSAFFMVQLSYLFRVTRKTIALTIQTFVGKMMSLLFNTFSRFVIAFLPRSGPL